MKSLAIKKTIVIGLDGADWRVLRPLIDDGRLPTLKRLIEEGCHGPLRSTIRPESSVAWSSFATGVYPGEHGVYSFLRPVAGSYSYRLANASNIGAPRFWDALGEAGYRIGLVNIPFTYPPVAVNGFVVGGMLTPGSEVVFTYPPELQAQILSHFPNYQVDAADDGGDKDALINSVASYTEQQLQLALLLLKEKSWDFFAVAFTGPDRLQHFFWGDMDPEHPAHDAIDGRRYGRVIQDHFERIDEAIAQLLAELPEDTLILIMSDHGFNGCSERFFVNRWLEEQGYLAIKRQGVMGNILVDILDRLKSVSWLRRLKRSVFPGDWGPSKLRVSQMAQKINWSQTRAYYSPDGGIRINLKGREAAGIVPRGQSHEILLGELKQRLLDLISDRTGHSPLANVFLRNELYQGRYADLAPDLILEPHREHPEAAINTILDGTLEKEGGVFGSSNPYTGNHAVDGILIASGPGVIKDQVSLGAELVDLAPTVLAAMGVSIPGNIEGKALSRLFIPGALPETDRQTIDKPQAPEQVSNDFSEEEETVVEARLRNLGYLD